MSEEDEIKKRKIEENDDSGSDNEGWIGPLPSEAAPIKKQKVLEFENIYLDNLPSGDNYEKSFMHRDALQFTAVTKTDFVITASIDGHVKFWKKHIHSIEFVKHFRAHLGTIQDLSVNLNGTLLCTISDDKQCKVFDVINFDMINIIRFDFLPECCQWIHRSGDTLNELAVAEKSSHIIRIYDGKGDGTVPITILTRLHMKPVTSISYNSVYDVVISADSGGMLEYWNKSDTKPPSTSIVTFDSKLDTDLYELAKVSTHAVNLSVSENGNFFVCFGADRLIRIFKFRTGKLSFVVDESLKHYIETQHRRKLLPTMDFNKKISVEKELEKSGNLRCNNVVFDKSGHFILYSSMMGIKMVNVVTGKCVKIMGRSENQRFLHLSLFQGIAKRTTEAAPTMETSAANVADPGLPDPTLFCTANKKNRFYLFTRRNGNGDGHDRDVFNEKPSKEDIAAAAAAASSSSSEGKMIHKLYKAATIHTSVGDIHVQLFAQECPKTVENFCTHSRTGYYNGHIFHRVIKQFMIQTGDPTGIGTGGESIWGGEFEDEFHSKLRHDRPYTLSMANAGPNTNGSQFFFTVVPTPWLDNKHTVFGRVNRGMEVVQNISNVKTHPKTDKPYDEITIISITVRDPLY